MRVVPPYAARLSPARSRVGYADSHFRREPRLAELACEISLVDIG